jgi:hypothetical protein
MVEYERLGGKKMEKGGRMNEDIGWPPSWVTQGMVGSRFLLPPSQKMLNEDERSGALNDDLTHSLFLVFLQKVSQGSPPPCRLGYRVRER